LLGFKKIPPQWTPGLDKIEDRKFDHCNYSLKEVYEVNYRLAGELVRRGGGSAEGDTWVIKRQKPVAPEKVEVGFEGLTPDKVVDLGEQKVEDSFSVDFKGRAFVVEGTLNRNEGEAVCRVLVDGKLIEEVTLSDNFHDRRDPLFWNYDLSPGSHSLVIKKVSGKGIPRLESLVIYR
jgi:hypothetical protein